MKKYGLELQDICYILYTNDSGMVIKAPIRDLIGQKIDHVVQFYFFAGLVKIYEIREVKNNIESAKY